MIDLDKQLLGAAKLAKKNGQHRVFKIYIRMKQVRMKNALTAGTVEGRA